MLTNITAKNVPLETYVFSAVRGYLLSLSNRFQMSDNHSIRQARVHKVRGQIEDVPARVLSFTPNYPGIIGLVKTEFWIIGHGSWGRQQNQ